MVPQNVNVPSHIDFAVGIITEVCKDREKIPKVEITCGKELRLRHFQTGLQLVFK